MTQITVPERDQADPYSYALRNHATGIMAAGAEFAKAAYQFSRLSLREFEGARSRIAEINGCLICQQFRAARDVQAMFTATGQRPEHLVSDNGFEPDEAFYAAVSEWRESPLFSARERLAIEYGERFAEQPKMLADDEDFWARAHELYSDEEIVDLSHCVAAWIGLGRIAHVLGFDSVCSPAMQAAG